MLKKQQYVYVSTTHINVGSIYVASTMPVQIINGFQDNTIIVVCSGKHKY